MGTSISSKELADELTAIRPTVLFATDQITELGDDTTSPRRLCLCKWPDLYYETGRRYSTHWLDLQAGGLFEGHYFGRFGPAIEDWLDRAERDRADIQAVPDPLDL